MTRALLLTLLLGLCACGETESNDSDPLVFGADAHIDAQMPEAQPEHDARVHDAHVVDMATSIRDSAIGSPDATIIEADMGAPVEIARCERPLGGEPWENPELTEAAPGVEEDLMAIDLTRLPDTINIGQINKLFRGTVAFMLDIPPETLGDTLDKADVLARGMLGRVVAASFVLGESDPTGLDFLFLRRGLHRYYHCDRDFPLTLDGFRASIFDFPATASSDVDSIAKCGTRRLFVNGERGAYVAESLEDGVVRETEILLTGRRRDGNLDFLVYDADGRLSDRTRFPRRRGGGHVMGASPYVCTACHTNFDRTEHTIGYDLLFPDVGPCAQ